MKLSNALRKISMDTTVLQCGLFALLVVCLPCTSFAEEENKDSAKNAAAASATPAPATPTIAPSTQPSANAWKSLSVYPPVVKLSAQTDVQHLIAIATRADGVTKDVTDLVEWSIAAPELLHWKDFVLSPKADGTTQVTATWNGMSAGTSVENSNSQQPRSISFERDVMPVLTKVGCNTGSCHGAARGKDGFRLSLFGYDPAGDYQRITREIGIRRINLAVPEQSLILLKAVGAVQHSGGKKIEPGSQHYQTILTWLKNGAPIDATRPPAVTKVDLYPSQAVIEGQANKQRLVAVATYADGTQRDVWDLAAFTTNSS